MRTTARVRRVRDARLEFSRDWLELRNPYAPLAVLTEEQVEITVVNGGKRETADVRRERRNEY